MHAKIFKIVVAFCFVLLFATCKSNSSETTNKSVSDTYQFLRFYIHNSKYVQEKGKYKVIVDHNPDFDKFIVNNTSPIYLQAIQGDSIFLRADSSYLLEQAEKIKSFKIDEDSLEGIKVVRWESIESELETKSDLFWASLYLRYKTEEVYSISKPIFSKDGNTALAIVSYFVQNGGAGAVFVFKKKYDKWEFYHQLGFWDY